MTIRVLHLNSPLGVAGAERVLLTYVDHHGRSMEIHLASFLNHKRMSNSFTSEIESRNLSFHKVPLAGLGIIGPIIETVRLIKEKGINIVHSHGYRADVIGLIAAAWTGVPIVSTLHGWTPVNWKLRIYEAIDRLFLRFFNRIFCVTADIAGDLARAGVAEEKLVHLPNAVSAGFATEENEDVRKEFGISRDEKIILYVGRLSQEKGVEVLLLACESLFRSMPRCRLLVVGDGPLRHDLEKKGQQKKMAGAVVFCGHRKNIASFYKIADVVVIPSWTEGVPMVLLEALMFSLPVVCSKVGGIPRIVVHDQTGLLVEPGDVDALANAICRVLVNEPFARSLGRRGSLRVKAEYAVEPWVRRIEQVYRHVTLHQTPVTERKIV